MVSRLQSVLLDNTQLHMDSNTKRLNQKASFFYEKAYASKKLDFKGVLLLIEAHNLNFVGNNPQANMVFVRRPQLAFKDSMIHKFCNSHYLSHFATFFIDTRAKRSTVDSCVIFICCCIRVR